MILTVYLLRLEQEKGSECVKVDLSAEEEDIERLDAICRRIRLQK